MTTESQGGESVLYSVREGVAFVTLNRPERLNAMTPEMDARLRRLVRDAEADPGSRVIVITGAGRGFCSGADLSGARGKTTVEPEYDVRPAALSRFRFGHLVETSKPVIAVINGPAVGVGLALALFCDIRIAASGATLGLTYARVGLVAEYGLAWLLPRLVGDGAAAEMLLSGRMLSASEAYHLRAVQFLVEPERLDAFVREYVADMVTRCSPRSLHVIKQQLRAARRESFLEAIVGAGEELEAARESADFREGAAAFREKRRPSFTGG